MHLLALAFLALIAPASAASLPMANGYGAIDAPRDTDPLRLGRMFCAARLAGDMTPLEPFYAPKLARLLATAPGAVDWQGHPDRPQGCTASIVNGYDDTVGLIVEIAYTAAGRHWRDQLNLERTPTSWRLNNVFYDGGGNLRFRLVESAP